jgi:hypothetical protein
MTLVFILRQVGQRSKNAPNAAPLRGIPIGHDVFDEQWTPGKLRRGHEGGMDGAFFGVVPELWQISVSSPFSPQPLVTLAL